jgi:hypothetical protein
VLKLAVPVAQPNVDGIFEGQSIGTVAKRHDSSVIFESEPEGVDSLAMVRESCACLE